ncbi:unnamed protein product [Effrenium voratum]|uniref:Fe2OG dioxygenase domain-containing protein n=1 Tax=Effrenium voratum TaxID=2562239 RepID=A0AA36HZU0_9DINO|nr:unnamed protein product [Effrenium voratum]
MAWEPCSDAEDADTPKLVSAGPATRDGVQLDPEVVIWDESRRCFAFHWAGLLEPQSAKRFFQDLQTGAPWDQLKGKKGQVMRSTCWYVRGGCSCDYTYGDARVSVTQKPSCSFRRTMEELTALVFSTLTPKLGPEHWPNSANLNYYADGTQSVGWHSDDESLFGGKGQDCSIVSLSLGGRREFWMALKDSSMEPIQESVVEVDLRDGDIISMEGLMQKHTVHFLTREPPQRAEFWPPRINITWRWVLNHRRGCALRCEAAPLLSEVLPATGREPSKHQIKLWREGRAVEWRSCMECRHNGWQGGRNCIEEGGRWLCRRCADSAQSGEEERSTERAARLLQRRLVEKVKLLQRRRSLKKAWESFCEAGLRDPARHTPASLLSWLETVGEVPDDLQVLLQKAKAQLADATREDNVKVCATAAHRPGDFGGEKKRGQSLAGR